jgi:Tol biopolymer transport system component
MNQLSIRSFLHPALFLVLLALAWILSSCGLGSVAQEEEIVNIETIIAGTPSATPSPLPTATDTPTVTPTQPTSTPTLTPFPPTPTANPALQGFSYCNQQTGQDELGRFSARMSTIQSQGFPAFERIAFDFELAAESAPINARAQALSARDFTLTTGEPVAPGSYVLEIELPGWLHDEPFETSVLSQTFTFTNTAIATSASLRADPDDPAGAVISIGLNEPVIYRLALGQDGTQLQAEIARESSLVVSSDQLTLSTGGGAAPNRPVFFLLDGDIWRADETGVFSLTQTLRDETSLAVSPDGSQVAFCRAQDIDLDPRSDMRVVPSDLWLMRADGTGEQRLAALGVNCADPAFSPDGSQVAFSVAEQVTAPGQASIWLVPTAPDEPLTITGSITDTEIVTAGRAQRVAGGDEWGRFGPAWISNDRLIYAATAPDGRSTLFLRALSEARERDIGASLLLPGSEEAEGASARNMGVPLYRALGAPLVSPDGMRIAVAALREDQPGADLLLLDANGQQQDTISDGYRTTPLAWSSEGELIYMTTACPSTLVHDYTLFQRGSTGGDRVLVAGKTLGALGDMARVAESLIFITGERARPGIRNVGDIAPQTATDLWAWNLDTGSRRIIYRAEQDMTDLASPE